MGKKTTKEVQDVNYMEWTPSNTADLQAVRDFKDMPEGLEPALQAQRDRQQQRYSGQLASSYNQNIPNSARLAMQERFNRDTNADYGANLQQAGFDANQQKLARRLAMAEMTIGRPLANKTTSTTTQSGNFWSTLGGIAQGALGAASMFMKPKA